MSKRHRERDGGDYGNQAKFTRWSKDRFPIQNGVPTFVPPETFSACKGEAMKIFLLRAFLQDMNQIGENKNYDEFFRRKRDRSPEPTYNAKGERTNTREHRFRDMKMKLVHELLSISNAHNTAGKALQASQPQKVEQIVKKIYFSKEVCDGEGYRAIIGARGRTHKQLESETDTRITVLGKGTSNNMRSRTPRPGDEEPPHVMIIGTDEEKVNLAGEKIEFIISNTPEAEMWKQARLRELSIINGTMKDMPVLQLTGPKGPITMTKQCDAEYAAFMRELEGGGVDADGNGTDGQGTPSRPGSTTGPGLTAAGVYPPAGMMPPRPGMMPPGMAGRPAGMTGAYYPGSPAGMMPMPPGFSPTAGGFPPRPMAGYPPMHGYGMPAHMQQMPPSPYGPPGYPPMHHFSPAGSYPSPPTQQPMGFPPPPQSQYPMYGAYPPPMHGYSAAAPSPNAQPPPPPPPPPPQ